MNGRLDDLMDGVSQVYKVYVSKEPSYQTSATSGSAVFSNANYCCTYGGIAAEMSP